MRPKSEFYKDKKENNNKKEVGYFREHDQEERNSAGE